MARLWHWLGHSHPALNYALVGGIGCAVDNTLMLLLLQSLRLDLVVARGTAFVCAATSNWYLSRRFTFAECRGDAGKTRQ